MECAHVELGSVSPTESSFRQVWRMYATLFVSQPNKIRELVDGKVRIVGLVLLRSVTFEARYF